MINSIIFIICSLLINNIALANSEEEGKIKFNYLGVRFQVPSNISAMGLVEGKEDMLIIRYGNTPSKNYLSFTNLDNKYECDLSIVLKGAFENGDIGKCNNKAKEFVAAYTTNSEISIGQAKNFTVYYSINKQQVDTFILINVNKVIYIDTDFLDRKEVINLIHSTYGDN